MNVKEDARPGNRTVPALEYCRRWGPLVVLVLAADVFVAILAWVMAGLFLN